MLKIFCKAGHPTSIYKGWTEQFGVDCLNPPFKWENSFELQIIFKLIIHISLSFARGQSLQTSRNIERRFSFYVVRKS